jgi:hypothetical protein
MENVCIYYGRLIKSSLLLLQTRSCNFHTNLIALSRAVIHRARANSGGLNLTYVLYQQRHEPLEDQHEYSKTTELRPRSEHHNSQTSVS